MSTLSPYAGHQFNPNESNEAWSNLNTLIPDGVRVLDVGCSTGNFAHMLQEERGCSVAGIDRSESDVAEARRKFEHAYVVDIEDFKALEFLGKFDVIVFADVIEHLVDPRKVLRNMHGLLAAGGKVVYSIPNMAHMSVRLELLSGEFPYTVTGLLDNTHLHFYDKREIEQVFADAGFEIKVERPVVAEYTKDWMSSRLGSLGLSATDHFWTHLAETDAFVYQYIGAAIPSGSSADSPGLRSRLSADRVVRRLAVAADERAEAARRQAALLKGELELARREIRHLRTYISQWKSHPFRTIAKAVWSRLHHGR